MHSSCLTCPIRSHPCQVHRLSEGPSGHWEHGKHTWHVFFETFFERFYASVLILISFMLFAGLRLHSRWKAMREKYLKGVFGTCPRVLCDRHKLRVESLELFSFLQYNINILLEVMQKSYPWALEIRSAEDNTRYLWACPRSSVLHKWRFFAPSVSRCARVFLRMVPFAVIKETIWNNPQVLNMVNLQDNGAKHVIILFPWNRRQYKRAVLHVFVFDIQWHSHTSEYLINALWECAFRIKLPVLSSLAPGILAPAKPLQKHNDSSFFRSTRPRASTENLTEPFLACLAGMSPQCGLGSVSLVGKSEEKHMSQNESDFQRKIR